MPPPIGGSSQHPARLSDQWRRWSPYVLILVCILVGWVHGTFFIPVKPEGASASRWAARESQAIQEGANYALLVIAAALWIHRRRFAALQWLILDSLSSLVITGELAVVLAFLYGWLSSMGMPGLFWHHEPRVQFVTGLGVTLYAFWMLYLLFATYQQRNPASTGREFWSRYDARWPAAGPAAEPEDEVVRFFGRFGTLLVFVLVLPASFPSMRVWDQHRCVEWPWILGVLVGSLVGAFVARGRLLARFHAAIVRTGAGLMARLRLRHDANGPRPESLPDPASSPAGSSATAARGNPVLFVALLYLLSYVDQGARLGIIRQIMPAGVSLCVLFAAVASFLVWLQGRTPRTRTVVWLVLLAMVTLTGLRDYKVLCRDLQDYYPTSREQYGMILRNLVGGRAETRQARADGKRAEEDPTTYRNVIDLAALQEKQFEPTNLRREGDEARATREAWLENWKHGLSGATAGKPVLVVVCTSGGALRAALWTEVVLDHMTRSLPGFGDRVRLITGASGGMLGAARFVASINERSPMPAIEKDSPPDYLEAIARQIALRDLIPDMFLPWSTTNRGDVLEDEFGRYQSPEGAKGGAAGRAADGGRGIDTTFGQLRDGERTGRIPSIIFSPMIAEDGRRLLISNQPLADLVAHSSEFPMVSEDEEELVRRIQIGKEPRPMSQMELEFPLVASSPAIEFFGMFGAEAGAVRDRFRLSSAVRMSATFPYVTPSVVLPTDPPRHVVDAGYYDNFGVNLAARWIAANGEWIRSNTAGVLVVQIRAFRNERALKLYDPDYQPAPLAGGGPGGSWGSVIPTLHVAQGLMAGFREWFVPLQGAAQAQNRSMYFRNDEQLLALQEYFRATGDEGFFKTVIFTCDSHTPGDLRGTSATLNWYMTTEEFRSIKGNMLPLEKSENGRDRNALRMDQLEAWWTGRGQ